MLGPQGEEAKSKAMPQDGSVLGVHLPDVGTLHTDPGKETGGEEGIRHLVDCLSGAPSGLVDAPRTLITHQPRSGPGLSSLRQGS